MTSTVFECSFPLLHESLSTVTSLEQAVVIADQQIVISPLSLVAKVSNKKSATDKKNLHGADPVPF